MSMPLLLTLNPGSSTIKVGLFSVVAGETTRIGQGMIDFRHPPLRLHFTNGSKSGELPLTAAVTENLHEVLDKTLGWFATHFPLDDLVSVEHRVVHGGDSFSGPVTIDDSMLAAITELVPLAPLHQPQSLRLTRAIRHRRPHLLQSASFDTAFHRTQTDLVRRSAIPHELFNNGVKRYGVHGLSYQFVIGQLAHQFPQLARGKLVAAHLGSGASLCAFEAGKSCDTSMGFSTLDGIPMATRCGALDAGVLLYLLEQQSLGIARVISSARSRVTALVLPTDEEQIIANETVSVLHHGNVKS